MIAPPPALALLLLTCWVVMMFAVMSQTGTDQLRAGQQDEIDDGFDLSRTR